MEQIYTIPVNETFEECKSDPSLGCPFCRLYKKLESNELDLILGASMMEPDVRKKTNEYGFCKSHWKKLDSMGKKLPLALVIQSHLQEIDGLLKKPGILPAVAGADTAKKLKKMTADCYVCRRIDFNFSRMEETAALLWIADDNFKEKISATPFCLEHFAEFLASAASVLKAKPFGELYKALYKMESEYIAEIKEHIDGFARKFDYRFANEPRNGEENAIKEAMGALCGESADLK